MTIGDHLNLFKLCFAPTDGAQSITPKTLKDMMGTLKKIAAAGDREI